jgi:hypothetical protein
VAKEESLDCVPSPVHDVEEGGAAHEVHGSAPTVATMRE